MENLEDLKPHLQAATATMGVSSSRGQAQTMVFPAEGTGKTLIKYLFMKQINE